MKKRTYRRTPINDFDPMKLEVSETTRRLVLAIDVAKHDMVAALATQSAEVLVTVGWKHLEETPLLLEKLSQLQDLGFSVEPVMEATGTYGDVLRHQLESLGLVVHQVSGRRVHDAKVVYDGVASLHDAKSAAIIAKLHVDGRSSVWKQKTEAERELKAAVAVMDLHQSQYLRLIHQLESWLARYWPEVTELLELTSATLLATLARIGGPRDVAAQPEAARKLMAGLSHRGCRARLMMDSRSDWLMATAVRPQPLSSSVRRATGALPIIEAVRRRADARWYRARRVSDVCGRPP
jgi:hypothetical protein